MLPNNYELVLRRSRGLVKVELAEVWRYRDLMLVLVRRDFVSRFKQTILGPLWYVVNPVVTTLMFTFIFGQVAQISTDGLPQLLFYNAGLLTWNYFASIMSATAGTFTANAGLFGKVYFPRLVVPLSGALNGLFPFGVQLATFFVFYAAFKMGPAASTFGATVWVVLLPLLLVQTAMAAMGVGFWICAMTTRYRDLSHMIGFLVQIWMYATPVIFPLSTVPDRWAWAVSINPMAVVVESTRLMLLGQGSVDAGSLALSVMTTLALFVSGLMAFNRGERTFIDTV